MKKGKKRQNTFKFQNFAERLSNLNIDVYHSVQTTTHEVPENDKDTFFRETLEYWAELNCSIDFTEFYRNVKPFVQSFNQLVFHKDKIIELLKECLCKKDSLALEPCLNLLSQLSRDLVQDFYPHFEEFFVCLVKLLDSQDTKLIENAFVCLAYIFKFNWRYMVNDIEKTFTVFKCLLKETQKQHIQTFAAESFAFLIRKSKSRDDVFKFLLEQLTTFEGLTYGIGSLFFYTIKGVKGQLNSIAEDVIKYFCHTLTNKEDDEKVVSCIKITFQHALLHTAKEKISLIFDVIYETIREVLGMVNTSQKAIGNLLVLLDYLITFKDGKQVSEHLKLHEILVLIISSSYSNTGVLQLCIVSYMLNMDAITDDQAKNIIHLYLFNNSISINNKLSFCKMLFPWENFDKIAKPVVIEFLSNCIMNDVIYNDNKHSLMDFIIDMIHLSENWLRKIFKDDVNSLSILNFGATSEKVAMKFCNELDIKLWEKDCEWLWMFVVALSSMKTVSKATRKRIYQFSKKIMEMNLSECSPFQLYLIAYCIRALLLFDDNVANEIFLENVTLLLRFHPSNSHILQCYDLYCSTLSNGGSNQVVGTNADVYDVIKSNLNSPIGFNRLLTLNILKCFDGHNDDRDDKVITFVDVCINAENTPTTLHTYRDKLLHIQKLTYHKQMSSRQQDIIIRFLIGNLFINFSVLWEPIIKVLVSFANDECKTFWSSFTESLNSAAGYCKGQQMDEGDQTCFRYESVKQCFEKSLQQSKDERADYYNFRVLLWRAMANFPGFVETKSKDIVPLFLDFLSEECLSNDEMLAQKQNLQADDTETNDEEGDEDKQPKISHKVRLKTLCTKLKLFGCFTNPKALKKEPTLYKLYLDLLTYKDPEVQTLALNCLMTYKFPYLKNYKENFDKLMTDTNFRDELLLFSSVGDDELVKPEHKKNLMPILIRLLYGKLQRKGGFGVTGKSSASARRNLIMQFLCNCSQEDLQTFINLICEPFSDLQKINIRKDSLDITSVVPLRKQIGFLNMLSNILTRLNKKAEPYFNLLFSILLKILWCNSELLKCREKIKRKYVKRLKDIKQLGIMKLKEFFETVQDFQYDSHKDDIFISAIWPNTIDFVSTSSHNITPLLKLISTWSIIPRFQTFLTKVDDNNCSLLTYLFSILKEKSMTNEVEKEIMIISSNLLTLQKDQEDDMNSETNTDGINILKPFISDILDHLHTNLSTKLGNVQLKKQKKIGSVIPKLQLSVLSMISAYITNEKQCSRTVEILFPLINHLVAEDTQVHVLTTLKNLLQYINNKEEYISFIPSLLSFLINRKPRQVLCEVFLIVASNAEHFNDISQLISDTNAWNVKRLDEPDYDKRLSAFHILNNKVSEQSYDLGIYLPIVHNCLHFMLTSEDMALQDTSTDLIEKIVNEIDQNEKDELFLGIVVKCLLPAIKQGVKLKKEGNRFLFINLLSKILRKFDHSSFNDLKCLLSTDSEQDFFANITHIQLHRRSKSVHQIQTLCSNKENSISILNMFTIILPIITHTIFERLASSKDHNLLTETIAAIGAVSGILPWSKYSHVLRNYLRLMRKDKDKQKTIIRVVVAVLNNFHFELQHISIPNTLVNTKPTSNNNDENENEEDVEEEDVDSENVNKAAQKEKIYNILVQKILPQLTGFVRRKAVNAGYHKLAKNKEEDEDEILKVPIVYAIVKLLQQLPQQVLQNQLPGLLLRVSQSLRSQARNVRDMARDTLIKITKSLGASYLLLVVKEMRSVLLRGYQLHVLSYSLHSILDALQPELSSNDLDACAKELMEVFIESIFGEVAEEKEVAAVTVKLHEAKSKKSSGIIEILAKFISSNYLMVILNPLNEVLTNTQNHKTSRKVEEALRKINVGLQHNKAIGSTDIVLFVHAILTNNIKWLENNKQADNRDDKSKDEKYIAPVNIDIHEMPPLPSRTGKVPEISKKVNEHIVIEFALQLLTTCLKRQRLHPNEDSHNNMLDQLVELLLTSLSSQYNKVVTEAGKCFSYLVKFPLPTLQSNINQIAKHIFKILKKFSRSSGGQNNVNFDMVMTAFKTMTVLIRDYKEFKVSNKQIEILLTFVEEDLHDSNRQSTALPLLKAILSRKFSSKEIETIMVKVRELSIRSRDQHTQLSCRQAMLQYMLDYPLGKKLMNHLNFYISQLSYEDEQGRISSLEMLAYIFNNFPTKLMLEHAVFFFLPLTVLLSNDESPTCRKMVAVVLKLLMNKIDMNKRDEIFQYIETWLTHEKVLLRQVSSQLLGIFVENEGVKFERRLKTTLVKLIEILKSCADDMDSENESENEETGEPMKPSYRTLDKMLYNVLTTFGKIFMMQELLLTNKKYSEDMLVLLDKLKDFLLHPHVWIRVATSQLFSLYFASIAPESVGKSLNKQVNYFSKEAPEKIKELCFLFISQVQDENATNEISEQATKNLIYLSKLVKLSDPSFIEPAVTNGDLDNGDDYAGILMRKLVNKMCQLASNEATKSPKVRRKRTCVFRWTAGLVMFLNESELQPYLTNLLRPIYRELNTGKENELNSLAQEVLELIRSKVTKEMFATSYAKVQRQATDLKETRKRKIAEEAVHDPARFARRKQKANVAKKVQRKRKLYEQKPNLKFKKIKSKPETE